MAGRRSLPVDDLGLEFDLGGAAPTEGVGICLSGGGYRAMLFHLGSLRRLNETGHLSSLTRVSSVSGGSIVAGLLGLRWRELGFVSSSSAGRGAARPIAQHFAELVEQPILELAGHGIDVRSVLTGIRPGRIADRVARAYDRRLYRGATLQDLPGDDEGPRFVILATNLTNGALWRFSRPYMRDWRGDPVEHPTLPLASAVAASSAFPPVLSPTFLDVPGRARLVLTDGGVYDNLGLEPVVKRCRTVFVSDGGGGFDEESRPHTGWLRGTVRILETVDVQVRRLRRRQVVGALASGQRDGAFWAVSSSPDDFPGTATSLPVPLERAAALAAVPTRLARLGEQRRHQLTNWGYAVTDAALRTFVDPELPEPAGFPYPGGVG